MRSSAAWPMRVMIRMLTTTYGESVISTPSSEIGEPSGPIENGMTYIVRPRMEPSNRPLRVRAHLDRVVPVVGRAGVLLVAASRCRCGPRRGPRRRGPSGRGTSWGAARGSAGWPCRRRPSAGSGDPTPPGSRRTTRCAPAGRGWRPARPTPAASCSRWAGFPFLRSSSVHSVSARSTRTARFRRRLAARCLSPHCAMAGPVKQPRGLPFTRCSHGPSALCGKSRLVRVACPRPQLLAYADRDGPRVYRVGRAGRGRGLRVHCPEDHCR